MLLCYCTFLFKNPIWLRGPAASPSPFLKRGLFVFCVGNRVSGVWAEEPQPRLPAGWSWAGARGGLCPCRDGAWGPGTEPSLPRTLSCVIREGGCGGADAPGCADEGGSQSVWTLGTYARPPPSSRGTFHPSPARLSPCVLQHLHGGRSLI